MIIQRRTLLQLAATAALPTLASQSESSNRRDFKFYDELFYRGKPNLRRFGLSPIHVAYTWQIWGERNMNNALGDHPPVKTIKNYAQRYGFVKNPPPEVVLDIEHWPLYAKPEKVILNNMKKYIDCVQLFQESMPKSKISAYNVSPLPSHFYLNKRDLTEKERTRWMKDNDRIQALVDSMDFLTPSCYFSKKMRMRDWRRKSLEFIKESRRIADGKRVIPFIWPQYSDKQPYEHYAGRTWRMQLEFMYEHADGVILWRRAGGPKAFEWKNGADWWLKTKDFIATTKGEKRAGKKPA